MSASDQKEVIDREHLAAEWLVHEEISKFRESRYWVGPIERHITSPQDYDRKRFAADLRPTFPHLHPDVIMSIIDWKIYQLHLR